MTYLDLQVLAEIAKRMDDIQTEKQVKYKKGWNDCELIELKAKLIHKVNSMFLDNTSERQMRDLIHIINYSYFLYIRYKRGER